MCENISETVSVTATVEERRSDVSEETPAAVSISARRDDDFYDDGRQIVSLRADVDGHGDDVRLREKTSMRDGSSSYEGYAGEDLGSRALVRIDADDAATVDAALERVEEELQSRRQEQLDDLDPSLEVGRQWSDEGATQGRQDTHATATITVADGRQLVVSYRNAVDVGHQVFVGDSTVNVPDDNTDGFADVEIDALIDHARDRSPLSRSVRM